MIQMTKKTNTGQALPLTLVLLAVVSATVFYMFNTGQVVQEKMRLTNTADAVAYSAGVYEARVLNYDAYTNRAMIANEIAIGHGMGMASWTKYNATLAENVGNYAQYIPIYGTALEQALDAYAEFAVQALDVFVKSQFLLASDEANKRLMDSQRAVHDDAEDGRLQVMSEVARLNDPDVEAEVLDDDFADFTRFNTGNNRERMRATVERNRLQDDFLTERDWGESAGHCPPIAYEVKKVGGTGLVGFDGWKSVDTLSLHIDEWDDGDCDEDEVPLGYGSSFSADNLENNYKAFYESQSENPGATQRALQANSGNGYGGIAWDDAPNSLTGGAIPNHMGLSQNALDMGNPQTQIAVRVTKVAARQRYSGGASTVRPAGRLAKFQGQHRNGGSASISRAEVYFERPDGANSLYNKAEVGSLFNPYWQVHLVPTTDDDRDEAIRRQ